MSVMDACDSDIAHQVLEAAPSPIAMFDGQDRMTFCNKAFATLSPYFAGVARPGVPFSVLLKTLVDHGEIEDARVEDEEAWIAQRMKDRETGRAAIRRWRDGRVFHVYEKPMQGGGTIGVWTEISTFDAQPTLKDVANILNNQLQIIQGALELELLNASPKTKSALRQAHAACLICAAESRSLAAQTEARITLLPVKTA